MMSSPKRRTFVAVAALAAVASTVLVSSTSQAEPAANRKVNWVGTWAAAPTVSGAGSSRTGFNDQTVRQIVHTSVAGEGLRIRLSNTFGDHALTVGHATVALPDTTTADLTDIVPGTVHELSFNTHPTATVTKGGQIFSDAVKMTLPAEQDLVVTIYFPVATGAASWHWTARATSYWGAGDHAADAAGTAFTSHANSWYFLTGVDVQSRWVDESVVFFGDSLIDGTNSALNGNKRWPDRLGVRLDEQVAYHKMGILNEGLAGNRITGDGIEIGYNELGLNAFARLHRDVLSQTAVGTVVMQIGINDLFFPPNATAEQVINGLQQLSAQIQTQNLRLIMCTLMPWEGSSGYSPEREVARQAVNAYIRTSGDFHAVFDFDALMRDPAQPSKMRAEFLSADFIHPNDAGYQAMADSVVISKLRY